MESDQNGITCRNCGRAVLMSPGNSVLFHYTSQPWFDHWIICCDNCQTYHRCFIRNNWRREVTWCTSHDCGVIQEQFAEPPIVAAFEQTFQVSEAQERELTPYEEKEVKFWEWLLNHHGMSGFQQE